MNNANLVLDMDLDLDLDQISLDTSSKASGLPP